MIEKRRISSKEYLESIEKLAIMIDESGFKPSHIISIARGGLRVGDVLSRLFRVRSSYLGVESYDIAEKGKVSDKQKDEVIFSRDISSTTQDYGHSILICDDLVDSGKSLIYTKKFLLNYEPFKLADILSSYSAQRVTAHFTANGDTNYDINNERDDCRNLVFLAGDR